MLTIFFLYAIMYMIVNYVNVEKLFARTIVVLMTLQETLKDLVSGKKGNKDAWQRNVYTNEDTNNEMKKDNKNKDNSKITKDKKQQGTKDQESEEAMINRYMAMANRERAEQEKHASGGDKRKETESDEGPKESYRDTYYKIKGMLQKMSEELGVNVVKVDQETIEVANRRKAIRTLFKMRANKESVVICIRPEHVYKEENMDNEVSNKAAIRMRCLCATILGNGQLNDITVKVVNTMIKGKNVESEEEVLTKIMTKTSFEGWKEMDAVDIGNGKLYNISANNKTVVIKSKQIMSGSQILADKELYIIIGFIRNVYTGTCYSVGVSLL